MSDFSDRIRTRRKELKLTLRELGAKCGLSATFLCEVECGKRGIGADSLLAVGEAIGLPLDQLMKGGEAQTSGVDVKLPASLMRFATEANIPFRNAMTLLWMQKTIMDHRTNEKRVSLELVDWLLFYEAVKTFL